MMEINLGTVDEKSSTKLHKQTCPKCGENANLRVIIYGILDPETFDFEKYAVGGCCINSDGTDPDISCKNCDRSGQRKSRRTVIK